MRSDIDGHFSVSESEHGGGGGGDGSIRVMDNDVDKGCEQTAAAKDAPTSPPPTMTRSAFMMAMLGSTGVMRCSLAIVKDQRQHNTPHGSK